MLNVSLINAQQHFLKRERVLGQNKEASSKYVRLGNYHEGKKSHKKVGGKKSTAGNPLL